MRIGFFSPYIPKHFGGGEKHFLTTAWYLSQNHQIDVLIPTHNALSESDFVSKYEKLFDLDLKKVTFISSALADGQSNPLKT